MLLGGGRITYAAERQSMQDQLASDDSRDLEETQQTGIVQQTTGHCWRSPDKVVSAVKIEAWIGA